MKKVFLSVFVLILLGTAIQAQTDRPISQNPPSKKILLASRKSNADAKYQNLSQHLRALEQAGESGNKNELNKIKNQMLADMKTDIRRSRDAVAEAMSTKARSTSGKKAIPQEDTSKEMKGSKMSAEKAETEANIRLNRQQEIYKQVSKLDLSVPSDVNTLRKLSGEFMSIAAQTPPPAKSGKKSSTPQKRSRSTDVH